MHVRGHQRSRGCAGLGGAAVSADAACGQQKPGFQGRPHFGANSLPCVLSTGHDGAHVNEARKRWGDEEDGGSSALRVPSGPKGTPAVWVSDPDEDDKLRYVNARHVLDGSRAALADPGITQSEVHRVARMLAGALADVLDMSDA